MTNSQLIKKIEFMNDVTLFDFYFCYNRKYNEYRLFLYSYITDQYFLFIDDHGIQITQHQFNYEIDKNKSNEFILDLCLTIDFHEIEVHNAKEK